MTTDTSSAATTPDELEERRKAAREKAEREEQTVKARAELRRLAKSVQQGEWLTVCRKLAMSRAEIGDDHNLSLLALAYIKDKRENGASSFEVLLELTDSDLLEFHGFPTDDEDDEDAADQ